MMTLLHVIGGVIASLSGSDGTPMVARAVLVVRVESLFRFSGM